MTKKMRIVFVICIFFILSVVLFTAGFLAYLQSSPLDTAYLVNEAAPIVESSYGISDFGDLYSFGIIFMILMMIIFFIAKA